MPRYVLIMVDRYPSPNTHLGADWDTWANGRYLYPHEERARVIEADAADDQAAVDIARAYEIDNCGGIPTSGARPMAILTMYRVEEVPVNGLAVQAAFIAEIDAATQARIEAREREQLTRLKAKYEGK